MSRGSYEEGGASSGEEENREPSNASSDPELPSDDDSDYGKPKKKTPKKKTPAKKKGSTAKKGSAAGSKKKKATPRGKISPAKTPASKAKKYNYDSDEIEEIDDDGDDYKPSKKKAAGKRKSAKRSIDFDEYSETPKKRKAGGGGGGGRSSGRSPAKKPKYNDDEEEEDDDSDIEEVGQVVRPSLTKGKKGRGRPSLAPKSKKPAPKAKKSSKAKKGPKDKASKYYDPSESEQEEDESEEEEEDESEDEEPSRYMPKKGAYLSSKKQMKTPKRTPVKAKPEKEKLPPVSEMVVESIKALKDNPKKGSTLRSIKETIEMNWPINLKKYNEKIKKYITNAVETGEIIRTKGKGFSGRFTVPGMKVHRRKKKTKNGLTKKYDEDEVEYKPGETERAKAKEETQVELEKAREERRILEEKKMEEKANRPVKPQAPRRTEYEVEKITGVKEHKDGSVDYLVKWVGFNKPTWEKESNVQGCQDLIDAYMIVKEKKDREKEEYIKNAEEEGNYEVAKIVDFSRKKTGKREFLVRWKGFTWEDDTWEPEENLDCVDLIDKFMADYEDSKNYGGKERLRVAPKRIDRLQYASNARQRKKGAFRINYADMDDDDYADDAFSFSRY